VARRRAPIRLRDRGRSREGPRSGRVGDTPIVGCGFYCGPLGAIGATGIGEAIVRQLLARTVYDWLAAGRPLQEALDAGIALFDQDTDVGLIGERRRACEREQPPDAGRVTRVLSMGSGKAEHRSGGGHLVIIGGGEDRKHDKVVLSRFVELAGGEGARIVVLTAASTLRGPQARCYFGFVHRDEEVVAK
jgi:hypothetical protein